MKSIRTSRKRVFGIRRFLNSSLNISNRWPIRTRIRTRILPCIRKW